MKMISFRTKLSDLLEERGMSQADLGRLTGLPVMTINRYCHGDLITIEASVISAIMTALNLDSFDPLLSIQAKPDQPIPDIPDYCFLATSKQAWDWYCGRTNRAVPKDRFIRDLKQKKLEPYKKFGIVDSFPEAKRGRGLAAQGWIVISKREEDYK